MDSTQEHQPTENAADSYKCLMKRDRQDNSGLPVLGTIKSTEELLYWSQQTYGFVKMHIEFHVRILTKRPITGAREYIERELKRTRICLTARSPGVVHQLLAGVRKFVEEFRPELSDD